MKKLTFTLLTLLTAGSLMAQNGMLQSPQTGNPFTGSTPSLLTLASNGTDVVLLLSDNVSGKIFAIDIADQNPADAPANTITEVSNFTAALSAAIGVTVSIMNFEVNPISRSVYVLCRDQNGATYVAVVKNNGTSINLLNFNNVTYSAVSYTSSGKFINDMVWGDNTLYISSGGYSVDGEVGKVSAPFVHGASTTNRATSMFKSNWGNNYWTTAPLEKLALIKVGTETRLAGVTLCAPGFSLPVSDLDGSGVLEVDQHFDVVSAIPFKLIGVEQDNKPYLFDLHMGWPNNQLIRIGQKYIDGSRVTANDHNENADQIRDFNGNVAPGITEDEVKIYSGSYTMMAFISNDEFLALDNTDRLKPISVSSTTSIEKPELSERMILAYPNPATSDFTLELKDPKLVNSELVLYTIEGKKALSQMLSSQEQKVATSALEKGNYILSVIHGDKVVHNEAIIIK